MNGNSVDNFRQIDVYPTLEELLSNKLTDFYENQVYGPYDSINQYLDVHFRLLRQDFIAPLRDNLQLYLDNKKYNRNARLDKIIVHKKVQILQVELINSSLCYRIKFANSSDSNNLMNGALVCLSKTNFQSVLLGRIENCNNLSIGEIVVSFKERFLQNIEFKKQKYVMIEYSAFFEPYYQVLSRLQQISTYSFPMERYIVYVERIRRRPTYLQNVDLSRTAVARRLSDKMNESQRTAFNAAFDHEMVIIQGPPGTGKTYLTLKITQVLISFPQYWCNGHPMLVICFTNHALDQFLEGISKFTDKIVRVGGQSKNENLAKFNLRNKNRREGSRGFYIARKNMKTEENLLKELIRRLNELKQFTGYNLVQMRMDLTSAIDTSYKKYRSLYNVWQQHKLMEDVALLQKSLVIGMTTTCAARMQPTLKALKCPIVVVEEAAEVLEAHILAALTPYTQHLLLIGDHQQLRPSTADYSIETDYKLGISLFERMVLNQMEYFTLNVQHRMKPEIAALISPTIYSDLANHSSVFNRNAIRSIDSSLFFIQHEHPEKGMMETSKMNPHEIDYLIKLAQRLILNGYKPENITILAAYLGQMVAISKKVKKDGLLKNVRVVVVDNYQGEECEIILLSLVRNNARGSVGFLKNVNRVCVALSRARDGLYIMGNMQQLCKRAKRANIWSKINDTLHWNNNISDSLPLRCEIHGTKLFAKEPNDFPASGGCREICNLPMKCGRHFCRKLCHLDDIKHKKLICYEVCKRPLCSNVKHICTKQCNEQCGLCTYKVNRKLSCNHVISTECYRRFDAYSCNLPCNRYNANCSMPNSWKHLCKLLCFEMCNPCDVRVTKSRTLCSHSYIVPCFYNVDEVQCWLPCERLLGCGHKCTKLCNEICSQNDCNVMVDVRVDLLCGHSVRRLPCNLRNSALDEKTLEYCLESCDEQLKCGHRCSGTCIECFQGRVHKHCIECSLIDDQVNDVEHLNLQRYEIWKDLEKLSKQCFDMEAFDAILDIKSMFFRTFLDSKTTYSALNGIRTLIQVTNKIFNTWKQINDRSRMLLILIKPHISKQSELVSNIALRPVLFDQEIEDIKGETDRLLQLIQYENELISFEQKSLVPKKMLNWIEILKLLDKIEVVLYSFRKYTKEDDENVKHYLTEFTEKHVLSRRIINNILWIFGFRK